MIQSFRQSIILLINSLKPSEISNLEKTIKYKYVKLDRLNVIGIYTIRKENFRSRGNLQMAEQLEKILGNLQKVELKSVICHWFVVGDIFYLYFTDHANEIMLGYLSQSGKSNFADPAIVFDASV